MSDFKPLQLKRPVTSNSVAPASNFLRPFRPLASLSTPASEAASRVLQPELERTARFAYSLDHIPIDPPEKNDTGLPDKLKAGIENLSGISMDGVQVHYNSSKPDQVQALAYTKGTDIHIGPGQEEHLPHEAWHVVQQLQGRVKPTIQVKGKGINDNDGLEHEADIMGLKVDTLQTQAGNLANSQHQSGCGCASCALEAHATIQKKSNPAANNHITVGLRGSTNVIQRIQKCQECGHRHGSYKCKEKVNGKVCGCTSHSAKFDTGSKFNPGAGKHARMLERLQGDKK